jgi:hypothetical protein
LAVSDDRKRHASGIGDERLDKGDEPIAVDGALVQGKAAMSGWTSSSNFGRDQCRFATQRFRLSAQQFERLGGK